MTNKILYNKLGTRIVQEIQLLAEKKWMIQALAKIRNQRNCIQIERLHLESLKAKGRGHKKGIVTEVKISQPDLNEPSASAVNLMQCGPKSTETGQVTGMDVTDEEIMCNEQELDLLISNCIFGDGQPYNMEEDEDDDGIDDIMIDMNMLMNGNPK